MLILKFFVVLFAIISSLLWLSNFIADINNPIVSFADEKMTTKSRPARVWLGLIAAVLWSVLIAFF